jgi:hypothetical protein
MSVFQEGFDRGYKDAFKTAFLVGVYKALANCTVKNLEHPTEIENILSSAKKGLCYICETEAKEATDLSIKPISEVESCQAEHSDKILKILQNYFHPLLKEANINHDFSNFYT